MASYTLEYGEYTVVFQALAAQTTITFSSPDVSGYWGPIVDDVSVEVAVAADRATWGTIKSLYR